MLSSIPQYIFALSAPYPASAVIDTIIFDDKSNIVKAASGSDNWAVTWGDDGALYTAYGDGYGFVPKVSSKLSLGYARVTGEGYNFTGINIRSSTGEKTGDGGSGLKASGFIMVNGIIYMLCRNANNTFLAWSDDKMLTWNWEWEFEEKFGFATFINYGKNNDGAKDEYVYAYGSDAESAYDIYDHIILARVHEDSILTKSAYQYFSGNVQSPAWSSNLNDYNPVFTFAGKGTRFSAIYNSGLGLYLFNQIHSKLDSRFDGGYGIYDAPEPWGPFTTAFFVEEWDVGPGEANAIPTKWLSNEGKSGFLISSQDDNFAVRGFEIKVFATTGYKAEDKDSNAGGSGIVISPNPFNPVAQIKFPNADSKPVSLQIYSSRGDQVFQLKNTRKNTFRWSAGSYPSGIYWLRVLSANKVFTSKLILNK